MGNIIVSFGFNIKKNFKKLKFWCDIYYIKLFLQKKLTLDEINSIK